jgi:hypothetical protein
MKTPLEAFTASRVLPVPVKTGPEVVTVSWQQILVGKHRGGQKVDIHVTGELIQIWDGSELLKTVLKADKGKDVRV